MKPLKHKLGSLYVRDFHEEAALADGYDTELLRRLVPFLRPQSKLLLIALALMPLTVGVGLLQPVLIGKAVDAAVVGKSEARLFSVVLFYLGILGVEFVGRFAHTYMLQLAGQRTIADLRRYVFAHIQRLPVKYFDRQPVGRVVTRVTNDVDSLSEFFSSGAVTALTDVLTLVGIIVFMLVIDWELSLITFVALPPLALLVTVFRRFARSAYRDIRARIAQLNAYLNEQVNGVAVVQAYGREDRCAEEFERINEGYRDANHRSIRYDALLFSIVESVSAGAVALILWYASTKTELTNPETSEAYLETLIVFYYFIQRFFIPIRDLSTKYTIIQSSLAAAERIFGLLDVDGDDGVPRADAGPDSADVDPPVVRFEDVRFGYRPDQPVLQDISLEVRQGETVALVGATGSGKTTTIALLMRLYEYQEGRIELEGCDVRALDRRDLRRRFAVVPQDVFLFSGTVLENLALGEEQDEAKALAALDRVGGRQLVESREGGLYSRVEQRGQNFSAGERQLLAFARALYRDPEILVLDEATANVDSETEAHLQQAVLELLEGRTSIVVAHRLSTIRHADRILVFHRGRIAESGSHEALLAQGGIYARLHRLHFEDEQAREQGAPA